MKKLCLAALISCAAGGYADQEISAQHIQSGVVYGEKQVQAFVSYGHGSDGKVFLDPYIHSELKELSGKSLLDAGCGAADWAILAAQNGATVFGIDLQKSMIEKAQVAVARAGVEKQISLVEGNVEKLPFDTKFFDSAISVNVGCNLPKTVHTATGESFEVTGLDAHFKELARVMKEEGKILVTAPASFDIVFTYAGCDDRAVYKHIEDVLAKIGDSFDSEKITSCLGELKEVLRATFVKRDGQLVLVTDEKQLKLGEPIWRKIPEGVVPNYYHSEEEYLVSFKNAGLTCQEIKRPCFFGTIKYHQHRSSVKGDERALGAAYAEHNPFTIYYVTKKA